MDSDFEVALAGELESGLYWLNSKLSKDSLEAIASKFDYPFYYVDGAMVTDHPGFFVALTHTYEWPEYGGGNWDAIFDVLTESRYYEPSGKGIILFDQCHNLLNSDPKAYKIVIEIFKNISIRFKGYMDHPSMKTRKPFQIYTLLRGEVNLPIPAFIKG